jgi:protoporphyrinogen oxidase
MDFFIYDYIIIGGGIGGLYANYILSQKYNTLLLEAENELGGRIRETKFHDKIIKTGAGIGTSENKHLFNLLDKLKIKYSTNLSEIKTLSTDLTFNMNMAVELVRQKYIELNKENNKDIYKLNVKQFIKKYFGKDFLIKYIKNSEFYDYLNCDITYYIKYYDISDSNHLSQNIYFISWTELLNKLKMNNCLTNYKVNKIVKYNKIYLINDEYYCKKIVFALTLKPLQKLLNQIIQINIKKYLYSVPFCRIYTYHQKEIPPIDKYLIVNNELQKIIYMSDHMMMISYNDSHNTTFWEKELENFDKKKQLKKINNKIKDLNLNIPPANDIHITFWNEGVHYFKPNKNIKNTIHKLNHPIKNIYIVGEIVSFTPLKI